MINMQLPMRQRLRRVLLLLSLLGAALPWYFNGLYFHAGGSLAPSVFWGAAMANALTTAITLDVYLAAVAFAVWVTADGRLGAWRWAYVLACFGIGLAFAMPLYLAQRLRDDAAA